MRAAPALAVRSSVAAVVTFLIANLAGCASPPRGPVDLRSVETTAVRIDLHGARMCAGRPVALDVHLDVSGPSGRTLHVVPTRRTLDDVIFDIDALGFSSAEGRFERGGVFVPSSDVVALAQSGVRIAVRPPRGRTVLARFAPSYDCTTMLGAEGAAGAAGTDGRDALSTEEEDAIPRAGDAGASGSRGGDGPRFAVFVTWARTPDHAKVLLARATGDLEAVTLVDPDLALDVVARGGRGGSGGRGGAAARATTSEQRGGDGGHGGRGGRGGDGGDVTVVVDERFPELEARVRVDIDGGEGGEGGRGGPGGAGFSGFVDVERSATETAVGTAVGIAAVLAGGRNRNVAPPAKKRVFLTTERGFVGPRGMSGARGAPGSFVVRRGDTRGRFEGLGAIVPF